MTQFRPSTRIASIPVSPTMAVTQKARDLRNQGRDVISLSVGEPDFDTPDHIAAAGRRAIEAGETRYTPVDGTAAMKAAMIEKFKRDNGLDYRAAEVSAVSGGKFAIYAAMMATLDPGDEVIIPAPYWVSYPDIVRLGGGVPVVVSAGAEEGFVPSAAKIEAAITERTRWLFLNSPNNPSGAVFSEADLRAIGEVLERHPHVWLLTDDIYEHLVFDATFTTLPQLMPQLKERTLIVNGASKAYAMTGWRLGIAAGPEPLMAAMRKLAGQSTSGPCSITQAAAVEAFTGDHSFLGPWLEAFRRRRDMVTAALNALPGASCPTPQGAFYCFPDVREWMGQSVGGAVIEDDVALCEAILEEVGVAVVPGSAFGSPGYFRLSYATSDALLEDAMSRLSDFAARLR